MATIKSRLARTGEGDALSALCVRSKAHWGYDPEFMRLSQGVLSIDSAAIAERRVFVAPDANDVPLGVANVAPRKTDAELTHLFVEPRAIGQGLGATLFLAALEWTRNRGHTGLLIAADPNATGFYEKMGAVCIGAVPSESIPDGHYLCFAGSHWIDPQSLRRENEPIAAEGD